MKCKEKCKKVEWRFQNFISINKVYDDVGFHKPFSPSYYTIAIWDSNRSNLFRGSMVKRRNCKVLIFRGLIQETSWLNGLPVIQGCPATKLHLDWNAFTVKRNFTFVSCSLAPSQRVIIFAFQPTSTSSIRLWSNNLRFTTEDCFHSFHVQHASYTNSCIYDDWSSGGNFEFRCWKLCEWNSHDETEKDMNLDTTIQR